MRAHSWFGTLVSIGCAALAVTSCAEVLGLEDRPVDNSGGGGSGGQTTTSSGATGGCTDAGCGVPCEDGKRNGDETDVDCGGTCPLDCGWAKKCKSSEDCKSKLCAGGMCAPTCFDGEKSGDETGADCGGPTCGACIDGSDCKVLADCQSGVCKDNVCASYYVWAKGFGGVESQWSSALATDSTGVYVAGFFTGTIGFGGDDFSAADEDIYLARLDNTGQHAWSKSFGGAGAQKANGVAVSALGAVALVGNFDGNVDFGGNPLNGLGATDIFVAKFDSAGKHLWSKAFGGPGYQTANSVTFRGLDVLIAGSFDGSMNFGGGGLNSAGAADAYLLLLNAQGGWVWNRRIGGTGSDFASSAVVDSANNVIATGSFQGSVDFGEGPKDSAGGYDGFLVKFDSAGNYLWSKQFGGAANELSQVVTVDPEGNTLVAGDFSDVIDLGCGQSAAVGPSSVFVAKLDPMGNCLWSRILGHMTAPRIAVDGSGKIGVSGALGGKLDLGFDVLQGPGVALLKLALTGVPIWGRVFGDPQGVQTLKALGFGAADSAFLAGEFTTKIDMGGGQIATMDAQDVIVSRLLLP